MKGRELAQDQATRTVTSIKYLPRAELSPFIKLWSLFVIITEFILLHWGFQSYRNRVSGDLLQDGLDSFSDQN